VSTTSPRAGSASPTHHPMPDLTEFLSDLRERVVAIEERLLYEAIRDGKPFCRLYFDEHWEPLPSAAACLVWGGKPRYVVKTMVADKCRRHWLNPWNPNTGGRGCNA